MSTVSEVLYAVATELAKQAKESMPKLQDNERVIREWYENGIYYRETKLNDDTFRDLYDFSQRECRRLAVVKKV